MHWLWAPAAFAALARAEQLVTTPQQFEVDIVFPRNETYTQDERNDIFPIVFAIQNISVARALGEFTVLWDIMPYSYGWVPSGLVYDKGYFNIPNDTATGYLDTVFLVDFTNASHWMSHYTQYHGNRYMLQWYFRWTSLVEPCGVQESSRINGFSSQKGGLMFDFHGTGTYYDNIQPVDVLDIPECPQFAAVGDIRPNATVPECPALGSLYDGPGNPCAVNVDDAVISSFLSEATSLASASIASTAVPPATSTSTAGVGPARTVQTALAAGCVLCGLAL